jgi:dTDP-4-dehydrorhamnose reductase
MQKKIMIFGSNGQLGRELSKIYKDAILISHKKDNSENGVEFTNPDEVKRIVREYKPDVIINAVALTNVDLCEKEPEIAYLINSKSVKFLSQYCISQGSKLIQVSTDYVFDGETGHYNEDSLPYPINYYGLSKLIGDNFAQMTENSIIVRTSGVYGYSNNYPKFVYNALKSGKPVKAISGYYSPIHSANLAKSIAELIAIDYEGIINIAGERISRYDLAVQISKFFNLKGNIEEVSNINSMIAKRPFDSSLDISQAKKIIKTDFYSQESNFNQFESTVKENK